MIIKIEYDEYDYRLNLPKLKYEFIEDVENLEDIKNKYKTEEKVTYVGPILKKNQIKNLHYYGNTVISRTVYECLGETKILEEVERLTGLTCNISITRGDTVLLTTNN